VKHTDGGVFVLAVGTVNDVVTQSVLVDADDDVGVSWRHARHQLTTVARPRTLCTPSPLSRRANFFLRCVCE